MIKLRAAKTSDILQLLDIEDRCFVSDKSNYRAFWYLIHYGKGVFKVLTDGQDVIGYYYLRLLKKSRGLHILSLAIHPKYQKKNYGTLVLSKIDLYAMQNKYRYIILETKKSNKVAIKFYTKNGYINDGVRHNYYQDGNDAILMYKDLPHAKGRLVKAGHTLRRTRDILPK